MTADSPELKWPNNFAWVCATCKLSFPSHNAMDRHAREQGHTSHDR